MLDRKILSAHAAALGAVAACWPTAALGRTPPWSSQTRLANAIVTALEDHQSLTFNEDSDAGLLRLQRLDG